MNGAWQCMLDTTTSEDGTLVEGHPYVASLKIMDEHTGRAYDVLACERCGHMSVGYTDSIDHEDDALFHQTVMITTPDE